MVGTSLKGLHKQIKEPQAELPPSGRLRGQFVFFLNGVPLVSTFIACAPALDLDEHNALLLFFRVAANVLSEFRDQSLEKRFVFRGRIVGVSRPTIMNLVAALHTGDTLGVDPLWRVGSHIQGKVDELVSLDGRVHRLIQRAPVKNTRIFFNIGPISSERHPFQKGIILGVKGRTAIPHAKGAGRRSRLQR